ncbi:MAG: DUF349 domain-containing protein [Candidatus Binatia bacterium]
MGILDRLKPQPRWKHPDPAVRLGAIPDLVDAIELAKLVEHDPDAAVRMAASAKVLDPEVLGRVAASDSDESLRDAAADRLLALALDASNPEAALAAGLLSDVRRVSAIAKSTAADDVRAIALSRLKNERALGSVARQAKIESTAVAAAARLETSDELLATALNSEHATVALAAFERVLQQGQPDADVALLRTIATRAQQKPVARRARAMLQAIEDAENARRVAEEERRDQELRLCIAAESLARVADPDRIAEQLASLAAAWDTLESTDAAAKLRFDAGVDAARLHLARRRDEIAAAAEEARRRDEALATREELCRRIETIGGEDVLDQLLSLEQEWARLAPVVGYEREIHSIATRFQATANARRRRLERESALEEARSALEAIVVEAESLSSDEPQGAAEQQSAADRCRALARQARPLAATLTEASRPASDLLHRLDAVAQLLEAREAAARAAAAKARQNQIEKIEQLAVRARRAVEAGDFTLREGERLLRDVAAAVEHADQAGTPRKIGSALEALRVMQEPITLRVKELRDLDQWRRFGNAQRQEEIIASAEALVASLKAEAEAGAASDLAAAAQALREFQAQWQKVPDAPEQSAQRLWGRFRAASDFIRAACEVHFAQLRQERRANLSAKVELLAQAEALADSTVWSIAAARLRELQKAWEDTGPVPGDSARHLAQRFRAACNSFFTRRREDLSSRKAEWDANLAGKEALCERAEQLAESTDWDAAADSMKHLQVEWKAIGPVQHAKSEVVWRRFRAAADMFFERYHKRHEVAAAAQLAEHDALVVALESLAALEEAPDDLAAQVQELRTRIASAPSIDGAAATALHRRWTTALAALASKWPAVFAGTDLDFNAIRERLERLLAKVESLVEKDVPAVATAKSSTELLAERLRSALEGNALGVRPDEKKWRAAEKAIDDAQATWRRLVWLPGQTTNELETRFEAACGRVRAQVKRHVGSTAGARDDSPRQRR